MEIEKIDRMVRGWFIGNFEPSLYKTEAVEVAVKEYSLGEEEAEHYHKVATEVTVILSGKMKFNDQVVKKGDIVKILPGEKVKFTCLQPGQTVVVKIPGVIDDKWV